MPTALRAHALWKSYAAGVAGCSARSWVLRGASLEVARGECVAVLGARGAGATTLLHCLAGLRRPDAGTVDAAMPPLLIDAERFDDARRDSARLLLVDDGFDQRRHARPRFVREPGTCGTTAIIATHELARIRDVADRVLLLHHGRLHPFDRGMGTRRVAEPRTPPPSRATSPR
jgi:ABC-type multidrug transport system ATPase subunit